MSSVQQDLINWIQKCVGNNIAVFPEVIPAAQEKTSISVALQEYGSATPSHSNRNAPMSITCKFLIFAHGADSVEAQNVLQELLFTVMEKKALDNGTPFELELSAPDPVVWRSFGLAARPSFWISIIVQRQREITAAPPVLKPVHIKLRPADRLSGKVKSTLGVPLQGATVILPVCNKSVLTDSHGQFQFGSVLFNTSIVDIIISYKQYSMTSKININHSPLDVVFRHKEL